MDYLHKIENEIKGLGFEIISKDFERPWGGFLVIDENQAQEFANKFFDDINIESLKIGGKAKSKNSYSKTKFKTFMAVSP